MVERSEGRAWSLLNRLWRTLVGKSPRVLVMERDGRVSGSLRSPEVCE